MKTYLFLIFVFLSFTNVVIGQKQDEKLVETVFEKWNQSTLASINFQLRRSVNSELRVAFKQSLQVAAEILYSPTANDQDEIGKGEPDRYKFLKAINIDTLVHKHFFIIETTHSEGSASTNFLVEDAKRGTHVSVYAYVKNHWKCTCDTVISKVDLHSRIRDYKRNASSDKFNWEDLKLTEFNSLKIHSRYFIALSLPENDVIMQISKL
jgi:hypothetical protein